MAVRTIALVVVLAAAGAAWSKPPGLPGDPHDNGRERPAVAHEFYLQPASPVGHGSPGTQLQHTPSPESTPTAEPPAGFWDWLFGITIPLGLAPLDRQ